VVENQPPPLAGDPWRDDPALREAVRREGAAFAADALAAYGPVVGGEMQELARQANENRPKLRLFDRYGHRLDEVEFHPAYHRLMELGLSHGAAGMAWKEPGKPGVHVARAALYYLHNQADQGTSCPM